MNPSPTCRSARRRTLVAVGKITRTTSRIETLLERFAADHGSQTSECSPATGAGEGGFFCEGRR